MTNGVLTRALAASGFIDSINDRAGFFDYVTDRCATILAS